MLNVNICYVRILENCRRKRTYLNEFKTYRISKSNGLLQENLVQKKIEIENNNRNAFVKFRKDILKHTKKI